MTSGKNAKNAREEARRIASKNRPRSAGGSKKGLKIGIVVAILAVIGIIVGIVVVGNNNSKVDLSNTTAPANLSDNGSLVIQADTVEENTPVVQVAIDFQCPACKVFEESTGVELKNMADNGEIILEQKPVAILDGASSTNYSSRAGNAFACVLNEYPEKAQDYIEALFTVQPAEGGAGINNARLASVASDVGATGLEDCISNNTYRGWMAKQTDDALADGLTATPSISINGELWDRKGDLFEKIEAARNGETINATTGTETESK